MFFSLDQIAQSLSRLADVHPFFGTAFLVFKRIDLPVGTVRSIVFARVMDDILEQYYQPASNYDGFYSPFRTSDQNKRWNNSRYGSTTLQRIVADTFNDAVRHVKNTREWGWEPNYVSILREHHLGPNPVPAFDLAVWLFRARNWSDDTSPSDIVQALFKEFKITPEETQLFESQFTPNSNLWSSWMQQSPVDEYSLLAHIGHPPGSPVEESAKLQVLQLTNVGPVTNVKLDLASRLNLITGDNGLGKTFLLDCCWWALTETWPDLPALPRINQDPSSANISFRVGSHAQEAKLQAAKFSLERQDWATPGRSKRNVLAGLCIYSQANDSFVVWDPAKKLLAEKMPSHTDLNPLTRLDRKEIWYGKEEKGQSGRPLQISEGLLRDWIRWEHDSNQYRFEQLTSSLDALSPPGGESLLPGSAIRIPPDAREIPTLRFPYGEVPITYCSAGIQRIVALAYSLVWSWSEHVIASQQLGRKPEQSIVLIIDEMEAHLHPFWQRTIVPAIVKVIQALSDEVQTQMIIATHSPLVMASLEPIFDESRDQLFHLSLEGEKVQVSPIPFVKRGRADLWLVSDAFGLKQPRSLQAENALEEARKLQEQAHPTMEEVQRVTRELVRVLAPDDEFWPRWTYFAEQNGVNI